MKKLKPIWTNRAKRQLKSIYDYYKDERKTPQGAASVKNDLLKASREVFYPEQYQRDEIQPEYRRIFVRHYKLLYKTDKKTIFILRIFNTAKDPHKQLKKTD